MMKFLKDKIKKVLCLNYERETMITELDLSKPSRFYVNRELSKNYNLKSFEEKDLNALMAFIEENNPSEIDYNKSIIEGKCKGSLFYKDEILIGYAWHLDKRSMSYNHDFDNLPIKLKSENEVYGFNNYIKPEHRGNGIALYFFAEIYSKWRREGYTKVYGAVDTNNISALWVYRILGTKEIKRIKEYSIIIKKRKIEFNVYGNNPKDLYLFVSKNTIRFIRRLLPKKIS